MAKMTQKRKAELYDECLNWIFEHCPSDQAYMDALILIGMTDEEIIGEMTLVTGE